ncbi:MAG: hypothetical protein AB7H90_03975 [Alphaproteobacteria bacterium]
MSRPYTDHRFWRGAFRAAADRHASRYAHDDHRMECLICCLPEHRQGPVRWLRSPAARWVRLPLGVLFILGSFLFILPIFGLWMLPVGLLILAEDVWMLRRLRTRVLNWIERHRPHWFSEHPAQVARRQITDKEETR